MAKKRTKKKGRKVSRRHKVNTVLIFIISVLLAFIAFLFAWRAVYHSLDLLPRPIRENKVINYIVPRLQDPNTRTVRY